MTYFDLALLLVVVISGLLAMVRGLIREVFTLGAWFAAGVIAFYGSVYGAPLIQPFVSDIRMSDFGLRLAASVPIFFVALLALSVLAIALSNRVLDSRVGAVDRTLGLAYGMLRGLVIFSLIYLLASKFELGKLIQPFAENAIGLDLVNVVSQIIDQLIVLNRPIIGADSVVE